MVFPYFCIDLSKTLMEFYVLLREKKTTYQNCVVGNT